MQNYFSNCYIPHHARTNAPTYLRFENDSPSPVIILWTPDFHAADTPGPNLGPIVTYPAQIVMPGKESLYYSQENARVLAQSHPNPDYAFYALLGTDPLRDKITYSELKRESYLLLSTLFG